MRQLATLNGNFEFSHTLGQLQTYSTTQDGNPKVAAAIITSIIVMAGLCPYTKHSFQKKNGLLGHL